MSPELRPEYKALGALILIAIGLAIAGVMAIIIYFVWASRPILGAWLTLVMIGALAMGWKAWRVAAHSKECV